MATEVAVSAPSEDYVPMYKWPPFPIPPNDCFILPFSQFKPKGIRVNKEGREVDGIGVATIKLGSSHSSLTDDGKKRPLNWKQKFEREELEGPRYIQYGSGDAADRLDLALSVFRKGKELDSPVQTVWSKLLDYTGLQVHENPEKTNKKDIPPVDDDVDSDFADDSQSEEDSKPEERLEEFLADPDKSLKIFFSSYFKEKAFIYDDNKLRDGPLLLSFFLKHLIREDTLPNHDLKPALNTLETIIRPELYALGPFQRDAEDAFSQACVYRLGTQVTYHGLDGITWMPTPEYNAMRDRETAQTLAAIEKAKKEDEEVKERLKLEMKTDEVETVASGDDGAWGSGSASGWDAPSAQPVSWDPPEVADSDENDKWDIVRPTLASWVTDSYTLLRTEESARLISAIVMPDSASSFRLKQKYATLVLQPWQFRVPPRKHHYLHLPVMLAEAKGEAEKAVMTLHGGAHRLEDPIEVIMTVDIAKRARVGLGINGVFVQAGNTKSFDPKLGMKKALEEDAGSADAGKSSGRGSEAELADTFWFIQHARMVFPSFWTELPKRRESFLT